MNYTDLFTKGAEGCLYSLFYHVWPWMGLGAAVVLFILIFFSNNLRSDINKPRMKDPAILAWLGVLVYLLHNFEEFGLDLYGNQLGIVNARATEGLTLGCNLALIWIAFPLAAYFVQRGRTRMAAALACFSLLNSTGHIMQGIIFGMYNPGLLNSALLCWPFGIWTLYVCSKYEKQSKSLFVNLFLSAVAYHIILIAAGVGLKLGMSEFWQTIILLADACLIFYLWILSSKTKPKSNSN